MAVNKVHESLLLMVVSDLAVLATNPISEVDTLARVEVSLKLLSILIYHRVIPHTPEELADVAVADLRNVLRGMAEGKRFAMAEEHIRRVVLTSLSESFKWYERDLRKAGIDPDTLPKIPMPEAVVGKP